MDFRKLEYIATLARERHFGRTAEACHLSPSALTRAIQRLEAEVGRPLVERDARSVGLTPEGEQVVAFAEETLTEWHQLRDELSRTTERLSGTLSVFASVTASQSILPAVLGRFREAYPDIHIELATGNAIDAMQRLSEGVDVVVAQLAVKEEPALMKRILLAIPVVTVGPARKCPVKDMLDARQPWGRIPLILPTAGPVRAEVTRWLSRMRTAPNVYSEVAGNEAAVALVAMGCGVGFVPQLVIDNSPLAGSVQVIRRGPQLHDFHVGLCTRRRNMERSPIIQAFWDTIEPSDTL